MKYSWFTTILVNYQLIHARARVRVSKVIQIYIYVCPTLCSPMDCNLPGSSVYGIFQAKILEWVVISSSRGSSWPRDQTPVSCVSCIGSQILYHCATREAIYMYIHFHILFHYDLSQDVEYSPLRHTVGPCCASCICQFASAKPKLPLLPSHPPGSHQSVLHVCESASVSLIFSFEACFRFYIEVISHDICLSLSDLLCLVW